MEQEVESEQVASNDLGLDASDDPALPTLTDSRARGSKRARTSASRIYCDAPGCGKLIEGKVLVRKRDVELAVQRRQTSGEKWCGTCGPRGELMHDVAAPHVCDDLRYKASRLLCRPALA